MKKSITISINIPVFELKHDDGVYVIESPALEVATQGSTLAQTRKRFKEAVEIFFEEIVKEGTVEQALTELGWTKQKTSWKPAIRAVSKRNEIPVTIPASPLLTGHGFSRNA